MRKSKSRKLARLLGCTSGNATLMVALGMPALIGAAGYGIDMAQLYMWKRELQHSVDQAALAGAWTLAYDSTATNYEKRALQEFNGNQNQTEAFDTTPIVKLGSYDGGVDNSVIVVASAYKKLPFSSFLSDKPMFVRVAAQATFGEAATDKVCLLALKKGDDGTFTVGGNATVNASCGLGALSCEDDALTIDGSADVTTDKIVVCGTADVPAELQTKLAEGRTYLADSFDGLPPPVMSQSEDTAKTFTCPANGKGNNNVTPGRYTGGWNVTCKVTMQEGVYVIDGGVLDLTSNKGSLLGTKVLFVLRNGAQLRLGGMGKQGNDGTWTYDDTDGAAINLSPLEASYFTGTVNEPYADQYAGLLFYEDKKDYSQAESGTDWSDIPNRTTPTSHVINGNSRIAIRGTFYLPNGNVQINGNSAANSLCFQLWAYTLKITGNTTLTTQCTSDETNIAGEIEAGVRLVG